MNDVLYYTLVFLVLVSGLVGLFYSTGGSRFSVENIHGERIELYGDGIYKHNSVLKAGANKGTDLIMIVVAFTFAYFTFNRLRSAKYRFLQAGTLIGLLYYSTNLVFGVTFNNLFLIYVFQFSLALFATISVLREVIKEENLSEALNAKPLKGTAIFLIVSGSSVLVWLEFIVPALLTGQPLANIEIYTTEPAFVLDLAIVFPSYLFCGIAMLKSKSIGYKLAPVLLTFITIVGLTVIGQSIFQFALGVAPPIRQLFGLVISFVVLGFTATILNTGLLKHFNIVRDKNLVRRDIENDVTDY